VLKIKRLPHAAVLAVTVLGMAGACWAQDADADQAKRLLADAVAKYKAFEFEAAKQILVTKVQREHLPAEQQKEYDEYLDKVNTAALNQRAAMGAYKAAQKALEANELDKAEEGFTTAAASEFLPPDVRADAKKQLALVAEKKKVAAQATTPTETAPATETGTAPTETTGPAEATATTQPAPESAADEQTQRMLALMEAREARAQRLLADGKKALDDNKPDEAIQHFENALKLSPRLTEASDLLEKARSLVAAKTGILSRYAEMRSIAKQEADVEFYKSLKRSHEILAVAKDKADFDEAESAVRLAQDKLAANKRLFTVVEYRERLAQVDNQFKHVSEKRTEWQKEQIRTQDEQIRQAEEERRRNVERQRQEKLATLQERARTLRAECKYEQALEVLEQILNLSPGEDCEVGSWAVEQKEILQQFSLLRSEGEIRLTRNLEERRSLVDVRESEIPWHHLVRYPSDWKALTLRREPFGAGMGSEAEADRAVRLGLQTKIPRLNLSGIGLKEAVGFLSDVSGVNIMVKWKALEAADITEESPVNVVLKNVSAERALRAVLEDVGGGVTELSYNIDEGVVTISTKDDLAKKTAIRVYDIRDLIYRIPNFGGPRIELSSNATTDNNGTTTGSTGGLFEDTSDNEGNNEEETLTKAEIIEKIIELIKQSVDPTSWQPTGEIGSVRELHGQLVITQTPENHGAIRDLIAQLREARALQIAIEARFISVSTGFLQSIGIDLDFYFNLGSRLGTGTRTITDPWTSGSMVVSGADRGSLMDEVTPVGVTQGHSAFVTELTTGVGTDIGGSITTLGASGMTIQGTFLDDIQVDFLIRATQAHSSTRSLTAPRLTLFNGQRAYVTVATQQAYIADLEPVVSDNAVSFNPTVAFVPTGSVLDVEATISADRRYVTLTVRPQVATLNGFTTYFTTVSSTDANGNAIEGTGQIQLPNVTVQDLQTTVSVPDGGTLLLGGQKLAGEVEREMGVPLLSKIPILNRAFTNRGMVRDEQTLLIMIKPKIIIQQEEEERVAP